MRRRPLSIRARWTLRYTAVLLVAISAFAGFSYERVLDREQDDAEDELAFHVRQLADVVREHGPGHAAVGRQLERSIAAADPDLRLGLAVRDASGALRTAAGTLEGRPFDVGEALRRGARARDYDTVDLPGSYPYVLLHERVEGVGGDGGAEGASPAFVQGALYTREFVRGARAVRDTYLWSIPLVLVVTAGLGFLLARGSLQPLREMNRSARRISATNLDARIPTTGSGDELDGLAHTLNDMIRRLGEALDRSRRFAANAAHQLRTPLGALRSRIDVTLERERSAEAYRRALVESAVQVAALSEIVSALLRLARAEAGLPDAVRERVALRPLLEEVVAFFEPFASERGVALERELAEDAVVFGDRASLHQLFANLLHNAVAHTPEGERVALVAAREDEAVWVRVRDSGPGVPPEEMERVFEPFHRTASARPEGTGLGLALAREIARAHGGDVVLEAAPFGGASFAVSLPAAAGAEEGAGAG